MTDLIAKNDIKVYKKKKDLTKTDSKGHVYFSQLDVLRAIAVLLVIISHWFSHSHFLNKFSPNGVIGVTLFFVLSGFLITYILLGSKEKVKGGASVLYAFKVFYFRRSLRIFPVYYLLIAFLILIGNQDIISGIWSHIFYLSNIRFYIINGFEGGTSHFWSLAVEEQFYLFWPAVLLLTPLRLLPTVFVSGIIISIIFRYFVFDPPVNMGRILMPASLDSFCIGGILAYGKYYFTNFYGLLVRFKSLMFMISLLMSIFFTYYIQPTLLIHHLLYYTVISICFAFIILICAEGISNKYLLLVFKNKPVIYIGKVSYGMYLFHNFIPYIYGIELPGLLKPFSMYVSQGLRFSILIAIASLSWFIIEKQFLKLKDRYILV